MKRIEFLLIMLFLSLISEGQQYTTTKNYVVEKIYLDPTTSVSNARTASNVTYLDGFGRKLQEIQVFGAPGGTGDLVKAYQYGVQGRTEKDYLPYVKNNNQGKFVQDAFLLSNWDVYGPTEAPYAFTLTGYDNSPLNRVVRQTGPGKAWQTGNKSVTTSYGMNTGTEVRRYRVAVNGSLLLNETYAAGSLLKETVTDEDGCQVETFKDNDDRIVLVVNVENASNRLETYSVYDDRGLLRYVLSPEASARLGNTINETFLAQFAYRYDYDRFGRMIQKRLPGCDPVYMVYDKRDRLVMSQDGKQRSENSNKWSYSLYDRQNRVVETGEVVLSPGMTHVGLQGVASASDNYLPAGTRTALQYMAYDNYQPTGHVTAHPFAITAGYATGYHTLVTGLVTSVKTRVLGEESERWLTTTMYYDDRCRVIQTASDNLQGRLSRVDMKYDFVGNAVQQRESHSISDNQVDVLESIQEFDDRGRLSSSAVKLNGGSPATVSCAYDAVGRLVKRTLGGVTETLAYNPRGWLTGKESEPFKMKLRYESPEGGLRACWNGNISEWEWQHGTNKALMYGFAYDKVNRLTGTRQKQKNGILWDTLPGSYLEKEISYDFNGNIKTLQRTAGGSLVDNLVYTYTGNQLTGLTEGVRTSPTGDVYSPGGVATGSYTYDKNGNMINDSRRALNLSYNLLNLLSDVKTVSGGLKARFTYLGDGTKLRVRDNGEVNGFDYLGSLTYKKNGGNLQLESASFGDGMIRVNASNNGLQEVDYFLTDHLGSVRVIVDGSGGVQERNDYYPFGARHVNPDHIQLTANRWKYNGKEKQVTGDLAYLDYGWRMYDSSLGRWFTLDPFSEKYLMYSNYNYCLNSPLVHQDIDGRDVIEHDGKITITGDDIYVYWSALEYVLEGKTPLNNFYEALDQAAANYRHRFLNLADVADVKFWRNFSDMMTHRYDEDNLIGLTHGFEYPSSGTSFKEDIGMGTHLIGPSMIALGQRIDRLKPIAALGAPRGSSIASATLSKVFPQHFTKIFGKKVGQQIKRMVGTNVVGRGVGRAFPITGIIITSFDLGYWHGSSNANHYEPRTESYLKDYFENNE